MTAYCYLVNNCWKIYYEIFRTNTQGNMNINLKIKVLSKIDFDSYDIDQARDELYDGTIYLVKKIYSKELLYDYREMFKEFSQKNKPEFHTLIDGCPDFHRINDEYEHSYVKGRLHSFRFYLWYEKNKKILNDFMDLFEFKRKISKLPDLNHLNNIPSDGYVSLLNVNHYPCGGGYLHEHLDPFDKYNPVQTIIKASQSGIDFKTGGVYVRDPLTQKKIFSEPDFEMGDAIIFRQDLIPHGVDPIDETEPLDWSLDKGRYLFIPLSIRSEYIKTEDNSSTMLTQALMDQ